MTLVSTIFFNVATVPNGTVAIVPNFYFLVIYLCFFFFQIFTDTTNFIIFSQLLTYQFLTNQNKIMKYEIVTNLKINVYNKSTNARTVSWHCTSSAFAPCSIVTTIVLWFS